MTNPRDAIVDALDAGAFPDPSVLAHAIFTEFGGAEGIARELKQNLTGPHGNHARVKIITTVCNYIFRNIETPDEPDNIEALRREFATLAQTVAPELTRDTNGNGNA